MSAEVFPQEVEVRVIECEPGKFAPVVSRSGEWEFLGGRVFVTRESAEAAAPDEVAFQKNYWANQLDDRSNAAVIGGRHYRLGSRTEGSPSSRGSYGLIFYVRRLDTGDASACSDLWVQGQIPDFALAHFPDTHEFIEGADA